MQDSHQALRQNTVFNPDAPIPILPAQTQGQLTRIGANESLGVLLLHGFTSSFDAVSGLVPYLKQIGADYEMPALRGHQSTPDALEGVSARDWYDDAYAALEKLCQRCDKVAIVGLSMGGLIALNLCAKNHACSPKIAACVTWAAALGFCNPLAGLVKPLSRIFRRWRGQNSFCDPECRKNNTNYPWFPTSAFVQLYDLARNTRKYLQNIRVPLFIIHSRLDQVVPFKTSLMLFNHTPFAYRERFELTRSGHELGMDCEAKTVFEITCHCLIKLKNTGYQ